MQVPLPVSEWEAENVVIPSVQYRPVVAFFDKLTVLVS